MTARRLGAAAPAQAASANSGGERRQPHQNRALHPDEGRAAGGAVAGGGLVTLVGQFSIRPNSSTRLGQRQARAQVTSA